jgi:hypothetical protein
MIVTRDDMVFKLAEKYFDLPDLIKIGKHMIGTGLIGGKTAGMLLARAILAKNSPSWNDKLEPHDSFYLGSDVFYTYLIMSKCWWVRWKQRHAENYLEGAEEAHNRMLSGTFPADIQDQFREVLNYFGQSPLIVRSSSLLEDAYGNAFSGKYDSIFCANLASAAVHAAMTGRTDMLVGYWHGEFTNVPLTAIRNRKKKLNVHGEMWKRVLTTTGQPPEWI